MQSKRILILAGTHEARLLANKMMGEGHDVISSFAGVTDMPLLPKGKIRRGGFGGARGLRQYLSDNRIDVLVDATHPFAAIISRHAVEASSQVLRLERAAWVAKNDDRWTLVPDISAAVAVLPFEARVFLTIGRKESGAFTSRPDLSGVARMIEPPDNALPDKWQLILQRPPFTLEAELTLLRKAEITHLVSKNAGGAKTVEKLEAAQMLGLTVVMIARPVKPPVETFHLVDTIAAAIACR